MNGLEPGIYFDLPASVYHADPALSRSDIVSLVPPEGTPYDYWQRSWMNPDRQPPKPASDEMAFGEAFHMALFEPHLFEKQYFIFPTESWDTSRRMISKEDHDAIVAAIKVLRAGRDSNLFLSGGKSEVTIVFDAYGLRFRARIDYLTPVAIVDFKTVHSLAMWAIKKAFEKYGYDIQHALYRLAVQRFREQFHAGEAHVFGCVDGEWFEKFMASEITGFIDIMQRKTAPYPFLALMPEDDTEQSGADKIQRAVDLYKENFALYGTKEWLVSEGKLTRFSMIYGAILEEN